MPSFRFYLFLSRWLCRITQSHLLPWIKLPLYCIPCSLLVSRSVAANHKAMQTLNKPRTNCWTNIVIASQKLLIFTALVAAAQYVCHHVTSSQRGGDLYSPANKNCHLFECIIWESWKINCMSTGGVIHWILKEIIAYCVQIVSINLHSCMPVCNFIITALICIR